MSTILSKPSSKLTYTSPDLPRDDMLDRLLKNGYLVIEDLAVDLAQQTLMNFTPHIEAALSDPMSFSEQERNAWAEYSQSQSPRENSLPIR